MWMRDLWESTCRSGRYFPYAANTIPMADKLGRTKRSQRILLWEYGHSRGGCSSFAQRAGCQTRQHSIADARPAITGAHDGANKMDGYVQVHVAEGTGVATWRAAPMPQTGLLVDLHRWCFDSRRWNGVLVVSMIGLPMSSARSAARSDCLRYRP